MNDECKSPSGKFIPQVNRSRCEGKAQCVAVCPYHVFEIGRIEDDAFAALGFFAKLKVAAHGRKTAYTPRATECHACGLCVAACPEDAIKLVAVEPG